MKIHEEKSILETTSHAGMADCMCCIRGKAAIQGILIRGKEGHSQPAVAQ